MTTRPFSLSPRLSEFGFGVLYWTTFLLVLEPGNLMRAAEAGQMPPFHTEALRIMGASLLGATSTPLVMSQLRRFPVEGPRLWRHVTLHSAANVALAFGLILVSCILAPLLRIGDSRPVWIALPEHVASNGMLLFFCLSSLMVAAHALKLVTPAGKADDRESESASAYPQHLEVRARGSLTLVNIDDISWIETQGNYQALHTPTGTHLIRATAIQLDAQLDPARFVRTHRRSSVAISRVIDMRSLGNGDAEIRLVDGQVVRVSRSHRESVRQAISGRGMRP
jgi:hypothetical protein